MYESIVNYNAGIMFVGLIGEMAEGGKKSDSSARKSRARRDVRLTDFET